MKILIIQSDTNERMLLMTPLIRSLKIELDTIVHLAINQSSMELFHGNPYVDMLHRYDQSPGPLRRKLRLESFDMIIDLKNNFRSKIIRTRIGAKTIAFKRNQLKFDRYKRKAHLFFKKKNSVGGKAFQTDETS